MRKFINWYSISITIILVSVSIFLFFIRNEYSEGAIFARPLIVIVSIGSLIVINAIKRVVEANNQETTNKLKKAAFISGIMGAVIGFLVSDNSLLLLFFSTICIVPIFALIGATLYRLIGNFRN